MIGTKYVFNYVNLFSNENQQKIHEIITSIARLFVVNFFSLQEEKKNPIFTHRRFDVCANVTKTFPPESCTKRERLASRCKSSGSGTVCANDGTEERKFRNKIKSPRKNDGEKKWFA